MKAIFSKKMLLATVVVASLTSWHCSSLKNSNFNLFTVEDDMAMGKQFSAQIEGDKKQFPILPEKGNETVYAYVRGLTQDLLRTGKVANADKFAWEVKIIDDDKTLNAFAVPGGYLYVYTGLIKFLDTEDQLAGVMGHEIAHAALRHSTQQMTRMYGLDMLRQIITGKTESGVLEQVAMGLISLKFSRAHETEADAHSVIYLCGTDLNASGAAGFFEKMKGKGGNPPEFLSTHPDPGNRVRDIKTRAQTLSCQGKARNKTEDERIKAKR